MFAFVDTTMVGFFAQGTLANLMVFWAAKRLQQHDVLSDCNTIKISGPPIMFDETT